jgi:probable addiction module antidote protein
MQKIKAKSGAREAFRPFDAAEYLKTEHDVEAFLDAVMEQDDVTAQDIASAFGHVARARNVSQLARDTGLTRAGLARALSDDGNPSLDTIIRVAQALGLRMTFTKA